MVKEAQNKGVFDVSQNDMVTLNILDEDPFVDALMAKEFNNMGKFAFTGKMKLDFQSPD